MFGASADEIAEPAARSSSAVAAAKPKLRRIRAKRSADRDAARETRSGIRCATLSPPGSAIETTTTRVESMPSAPDRAQPPQLGADLWARSVGGAAQRDPLFADDARLRGRPFVLPFGAFRWHLPSTFAVAFVFYAFDLGL